MSEFHEKECERCHLYLDPSFYNKNSCEKDGLQRRCVYCAAAYRLAHREKIAEYNKEYRKANLEKLKTMQGDYYQKHRDELIPKQIARDKSRSGEIQIYNKKRYNNFGWPEWIEKTYGITADQWMQMFESQSGVCAICKKECASGKRLCVDHNHKTGEIRGLLCRRCNLAIGKFDDDPTIMREAALYLEHGGFR